MIHLATHNPLFSRPQTLRNTPALASLRDAYILPALQHEAPLVRQAAVRALGLLALMGKASARECLVLLMQPLIHGDAPIIQVWCALGALRGSLSPFRKRSSLAPKKINSQIWVNCIT